jgi:hypothetical protein
MPLKQIPFKPGYFRDDTDYAAEGTWVDGNLVRFTRGRLETIKGWDFLTESTVEGKTRGLLAFANNAGTRRLALGTHRRLYSYVVSTLYDITPARITQSAAFNPIIATTTASRNVTVTHTAHGQLNGDTIRLWNFQSAVGGVVVDGNFLVQSAAANSYIITVPNSATAATSSAASGNYFYPRSNLANPFSITSGTTSVAVLQTAHNLGVGDIITYTGYTATGGVNFNGEWVVTSAVNSNNFQFATSATATGTIASTGGSGSYVYLISVGRENSTGQGYGTGPFGAGSYGASLAASLPWARTWSLARWGGFLLVNPRGFGIYEWEETSERAVLVPNAPTQNTGILVTAENVVAALGCTDFDNVTWDRMLIRWSDINDNQQWTPSATNSAGSARLAEGSEIITGLNTRGLSLIWTDAALYAMQFSGDDNVYNFELVGVNCGLIGPNAAATINGLAFWCSSNGNFYAYMGGTPKIIVNPNRDFFFNNLTTVQKEKIYCATFAEKNEIWWFYQVLGTTENTRYMVYNYVEDHWVFGELERTAYIDRGLFPNPIAVSPTGQIYDQEVGFSAAGGAILCYATSAPFDLDDGDRIMRIKRVAWDAEQTGTMALTMSAARFPNGPVTTRAYVLPQGTQKVDLALEGRQLALTFSKNDNQSGFRLGIVRLDLEPGGRR